MAVGFVVSLAFLSGILFAYFLFRGELRETKLMITLVGFVLTVPIAAFVYPQYFNVQEPKAVFDSRPATNMAKGALDKASDYWKNWKWK